MLVRLGNKYPVRVSPDFVGYVEFGDRHNKAWTHCINTLKEDQTFADIGAHIGLYTLPAALKLKKGRVYAFEPAKETCRILKKHVIMNALDNVKVFNWLVADEDRILKFRENRNSISPKNSIAILDEISGFTSTKKNAISIDSVFHENNSYPDVIKIDVEGSEILVLLGARETIAYAKPIIYLSIHPKLIESLNQSVEQLLCIIREIDYSIYDVEMKKANEIAMDEYILLPKS